MVRSVSRKSPKQLDREIAEYVKAHSIKRSESEKAIHPEMFAVMDRAGKILGRSYTVKGAMAQAPEGKTYAIVRGEFTSEGTNWGVGRGRQVAVREADPSSGFRWHVSSGAHATKRAPQPGKPSKSALREFDRADSAAQRASSEATDASDPDGPRFNPKVSARLHEIARETNLKAAALADALGFDGVADLRRRSAERHTDVTHATKRKAKAGLAEDPRWQHVWMNYKGRKLLGTIRDVRQDRGTGKTRLIVQHFNGEPWPLEPISSAVNVI